MTLEPFQMEEEMQFLKVSCPQCARYYECPQKTRLFVNYCGCSNKHTDENIREAILDCRTRQGKLFKRTTVPEAQIATIVEVITPVSP
jgi:hypothetical protein